MKDKITVVISIRNRDTQRIENQVQSIRSTGSEPSFHIIDYGSDAAYAHLYAEMCRKLDMQYTHMYAEGLPWNKCRALNYGAKTAKTPFIVTSDADMLYEGNPFQYCLDNYQDKTMYHIETYWLPKNGDRIKSIYATHENPGGFQFIARNAFDEIGGYDERMLYWGFEDLDFPERLQKIGYKQVWLPDTFKLYHQWHPVSEANYKRPQTATVNTLKYAWENKMSPILNQNWGAALTEKDRPILAELKKITSTNTDIAYCVNLATSILNDWQAADIVLNTRHKGLVKLILGPRLKKRPLDCLRNPIKIILKPFTALTGNTVISNLNANFDILYEMLPLLLENGLLDYYIANDLSYIYLLWS